MNVERGIISKAVQTGKLEKLISKGVDSSYFYDKECQEVWDTCIKHIRRYKTAPSFEAIKSKHADFNFEIVTDSFEYIYDQFTKQTKRRMAITGLREIAKAIDDPEKIITLDEEFLAIGSELSRLFPEGNAQRFSDMAKRIASYDERLSTGSVMGIPFGVTVIDDVTQGIQNHEYISIVGWQGSGKSMLSQHISFSSYLAGFTPLIVSLEMEAEAMFRRFDVMATHIRYRALKKMELDEDDKNIWMQWADRAERASNDIIVIDDITRCTPELVQSISEQYNPDLMVVDYVSLMTSKKSGPIWETVTDLTRELKLIARDSKGPPVISIAQTNINSSDSGAELANIAYSRSIGQDSDLVLGLFQDDDMKKMNKMEVRLLKNRDGEQTTADMFWNPKKMEFRDWLTKDEFAFTGESSGKQPEPIPETV